MASEFLKRMTDRHRLNPQGIHLARASSILKNAAQIMRRSLDLFTNARNSQSTQGDLQSGIQLLAEARSHCRNASEHMKRAADDLQSNT